MAMTPVEICAALRLGDSAEELAEATRLRRVATAIVEQRAPGAPSAIKNEAIIRVAAHLYDKPFYSSGAGYSTILRNSGAGDLLLPHIVLRASKAT